VPPLKASGEDGITFDWLRLGSVAFVAGADFAGRSVFFAGCASTTLAIPSIAISGMRKSMKTSPTIVAMRASRFIESSTRRELGAFVRLLLCRTWHPPE